MKTSVDLRQELNIIDRKSYPAYKSLRGIYDFKGYTLSIDHVQGDPFASPSKVSICIRGDQAKLPKALYSSKEKRITLQDHLTRIFYQQVEKYQFKTGGSGKSGLLSVSCCGQEVLERTTCMIQERDGSITVRFEVGFPANGRTIQSSGLIKIFFDFLPDCIKASFYYDRLDQKKIKEAADLCEDQQYIRDQLCGMGLSAFIADGSILPRSSGVSDLPMKQAIPFVSPDSLAVTMELPHRGEITGMGIRRGVTLLVGGGYHGKSTVLKALEMGVYNHIAGDGRELVITDQTAVKLRAEDSRSVRAVDISLFINGLPSGKDTKAFSTDDASGSTSQAANLMEGIEAGAALFLMDEDTSATNFMVRDELMQRVVNRCKEPITPFIERVRALYEEFGISSVIVAGSSGTFFQVADSIIQMDQYVPVDITAFAKDEARLSSPVGIPEDMPVLPVLKRRLKADFSSKETDRMKVKVLGRDAIEVNREIVDLRYVEQLVDVEQLAGLGMILQYAVLNLMDGRKDIREMVDIILERMDKLGMETFSQMDYLPMNMARPRRQEIFACFNRYRRVGAV